MGAAVDGLPGLEAQSPHYPKGSGRTEGGVWAKSVGEILTAVRDGVGRNPGRGSRGAGRCDRVRGRGGGAGRRGIRSLGAAA